MARIASASASVTRNILPRDTTLLIRQSASGVHGLADSVFKTVAAAASLRWRVKRDLIRARTGEGRARAIARGVKMGRKPKMTPHQMKEALKRRDAGEPMRNIAKSFNVSHSTISRLAA
jgi:DNA invertase Pin-like site-specific DNA recombinase